MEISQRARRIIGGLGLVVLLGLLAWGGSVWAVCGRSAGRVFGSGRALVRPRPACGRRARMREDAAERTRQPLLFAAHRRGGRALQVR